MSYKVIVNAQGIIGNKWLLSPVIVSDAQHDANIEVYPGSSAFYRDSMYVNLNFTFNIVSQDPFDANPLPTLTQVQSIQISNDSNFSSPFVLSVAGWATHVAGNYQIYNINIQGPDNIYEFLTTAANAGTYLSGTKANSLISDYYIYNWRLSGDGGQKYVYTQFVLTYTDINGNTFNISVPNNFGIANSYFITVENPSAPDKALPMYISQPWVNSKVLWRFKKSFDSAGNLNNYDATARYFGDVLTIPYVNNGYNFYSTLKNNINVVYRNVLKSNLPLNTYSIATLYTGAYSTSYYLGSGLSTGSTSTTQTSTSTTTTSGTSTTTTSAPYYATGFDLPQTLNITANSRIEIQCNNKYTFTSTTGAWWYHAYIQPQIVNFDNPNFLHDIFFRAFTDNGYIIAFDIQFGYQQAVNTTFQMLESPLLTMHTVYPNGGSVHKTANISLPPDFFAAIESGGTLEIYFKPVKNSVVSSNISTNYIAFSVYFTPLIPPLGGQYSYCLTNNILEYPVPAVDYTISNNFIFSLGYQCVTGAAVVDINEISYGDFSGSLGADFGEGALVYPNYSPFTYVTSNWQSSLDNFNWSVYESNYYAGNVSFYSNGITLSNPSLSEYSNESSYTTLVTELKSSFQSLSDVTSFEIDTINAVTVLDTDVVNTYIFVQNAQPDIYENYKFHPYLNDSDSGSSYEFYNVGNSSSVGYVSILWDMRSASNTVDTVTLIFKETNNTIAIALEYTNDFNSAWSNALINVSGIFIDNSNPNYQQLVINSSNLQGGVINARFIKLVLNGFTNLYVSKGRVSLSGVPYTPVINQSGVSTQGNWYFGFSTYGNEGDTTTNLSDFTRRPSFLYIDPENIGNFLTGNFVIAAYFDVLNNKVWALIRKSNGEYLQSKLGDYTPQIGESWKLYLYNAVDISDTGYATIKLINLSTNNEYTFDFNAFQSREKGYGVYPFFGVANPGSVLNVLQTTIKGENNNGSDELTNSQIRYVIKQQTGSTQTKPLLGISLLSSQLSESRIVTPFTFTTTGSITVKAASITNQVIYGVPGSIDGVTINAGDVVALFNQTSQTSNGVYTVSSSNWTLYTPVTNIYVTYGNVYNQTYWYTPDNGITWYTNIIAFKINNSLIANHVDSISPMRTSLAPFPRLIEIEVVAQGSIVLNNDSFIAMKLFSISASNVLTAITGWTSCVNISRATPRQPLYTDTGYYSNNTYLLQFDFNNIQPASSAVTTNYLAAFIVPSNVNIVMGNLINSEINDFYSTSVYFWFNYSDNIWYKAYEFYDQNTNVTVDNSQIYLRTQSQSVSLLKSAASLLSDYALADITAPGFGVTATPLLAVVPIENSRTLNFTGFGSDSGSGLYAFRLVQTGDSSIETRYPWIGWNQLTNGVTTTQINFSTFNIPINRLNGNGTYRAGVGATFLPNLYDTFNGFKDFYIEVIDKVGNMSRSNIITQYIPSIAILDTSPPYGTVGFVNTSLTSTISVTNQQINYLQMNAYDASTNIKEFRYKITGGDLSDWMPFSSYQQIDFGSLASDGFQKISVQFKDYGNNTSVNSNVWQEIPSFNYDQLFFNKLIVWDNPQNSIPGGLVYAAGSYTTTYNWLRLVLSGTQPFAYILMQDFVDYLSTQILLVPGDVITVTFNGSLVSPNFYTIDYTNSLIIFSSDFDPNTGGATTTTTSTSTTTASPTTTSPTSTTTTAPTTTSTTTTSTTTTTPTTTSTTTTAPITTTSTTSTTTSPAYTGLKATIVRNTAILMSWNGIKLNQVYNFNVKKERLITAMLSLDDYLIIATANGNIYYYDGIVMYGPIFTAISGNTTLPITDLVLHQFLDEPVPYIYASTMIEPRIFRALSTQFTQSSNWINIYQDNGSIIGFNILKPGLFAYAPTITFSKGGVQATALANLSMSVQNAYITANGSGYTVPPILQIVNDPTDTTGTGAALSPIMQGFVGSVLVTSVGSGYISAPSVTVSSPTVVGGVDATAVAYVTGGAVTSIAVTNAGSGYTFIPLISIVGTGTGASAVSNLIFDKLYQLQVSSVGSNYTATPTVNVIAQNTGATGAGATVSTVGFISSITLTNKGYGYMSTPTVVIESPGIGINYTVATAQPTVINNSLSSVIVTNAGYGYSSKPAVTISGGQGSGIDVTINYTNVGNGSVTISSIQLNGPATGYIAAPSGTIIGGPEVYQLPYIDYIFSNDPALWSSSGSIFTLESAFGKLYAGMDKSSVLEVSKNYLTGIFTYTKEILHTLQSAGIANTYTLNNAYGSLRGLPANYNISKLKQQYIYQGATTTETLFASTYEDAVTYVKTNMPSGISLDTKSYVKDVFDSGFAYRLNQWHYYQSVGIDSWNRQAAKNQFTFIPYMESNNFGKEKESLDIVSIGSTQNYGVFISKHNSNFYNAFLGLSTVSPRNYVIKLSVLPIGMASTGFQGIEVYDGIYNFKFEVGYASTNLLNVTVASGISATSLVIAGITTATRPSLISSFNDFTIQVSDSINSPGTRLRMWLGTSPVVLMDISNFLNVLTTDTKIRFGKITRSSSDSEFAWKDMKYQANFIYNPILAAQTHFTSFAKATNTGAIKAFVNDAYGNLYAISSGVSENYYSTSPQDKLSKFWVYNAQAENWILYDSGQNVTYLNNQGLGYPYGLINPYDCVYYNNTFLAVGQKATVGFSTAFLTTSTTPH